MSTRDHYPNVPKRRKALINDDGDIEALELGGDAKDISGTATLTAGTVTVTDSRFSSDAVAFISTKHPYPTESGINWGVGDGYLTVSGSSAGTFTIGYLVKLP